MRNEIIALNAYSNFSNSILLPHESGSFKTIQNKTYLRRILLDAISHDEFELVYQPQIEISGHQVIGVEALLRWNSPEYGVISPTDFIPLVEALGMINELGNIVIEKACKQAAVWKNKYTRNIRMAVNVSYMQVHSRKIVDVVDACITKYDIERSMLEIELTESSLVKDINKVITVIKEFKEMGVRTAIDDFGTGYSSLSHLARMPFDMIKIDRSFISMLGTHEANTIITESIIQLSKKLNMEVLAEGVETEKQRNILMTNQCDFMQGNLFCSPVLAENLPEIAGLTLLTA